VETARASRVADLDDLVPLWEAAVDELDGQRGGFLLAGSLTRSDIRDYLKSALEDPDRLVVAGFLDGVVMGVASAYAERHRREPVGVLEIIYVEPAARQVGVAEAMVELVLAWCRDHHLAGLDAPALPGNRAAKSFFEDHGFQARLLVMHRPAGES
jgi:GNAT superfamily N-acetyltransferase